MLTRIISGARYSGVPHSVHVLVHGSTIFAKPKSQTLMYPCCVFVIVMYICNSKDWIESLFLKIASRAYVFAIVDVALQGQG